MKNNKYEIDMCNGSIMDKLISFALPLMLSGILQLMFNAVDIVVVGRFSGSQSLAAVGSTTALINVFTNLFIGISLGTNVLAARFYGAGKTKEMSETVHTSIALALISGVAMAVIGLIFSRWSLEVMGTPEDVIAQATLYMQIYFLGMPMNMLYNFCAAILRAAGDTRSPLIYLSLAGVINVVLNLVFVIALNMNVAGVALATVISQGISAVLVTLALQRRQDSCRLELGKMRFYGAQLKKMLVIGLPAGIQSSLFSISNVLIQSSVNSFGDVFVSGNAASANLEGFVYASQNAFHQTALNYIGQNVGARQYDRIKKILWICLGCVCATGILLGAAMYAMGPVLLSFYITDSQQAISYGLLRLAMICLPYFLCGMMDVSTGALRGLGASFVPMLISILGVCAFRVFWIFTIFQIPGFHTPQCLFLSYPISWTVTFACQLSAFLYQYRKQTRQLTVHS